MCSSGVIGTTTTIYLTVNEINNLRTMTTKIFMYRKHYMQEITHITSFIEGGTYLQAQLFANCSVIKIKQFRVHLQNINMSQVVFTSHAT